jgi:hypothetical protein
MIVSGHYDVVLGSRILGRGALKGGMPLYKYIANRVLTFGENMLLGQKLSEYHTGYRAWSRHVLETLRLEHCSDDFVFDNQMLAQAVFAKFTIGEISCPTRYFEEASSINFPRSVSYGLGVLQTALQFRLAKWNIQKSPLFESENRKAVIPNDADFDSPSPSWPGLTGPSTPLAEPNDSLHFRRGWPRAAQPRQARPRRRGS